MAIILTEEDRQELHDLISSSLANEDSTPIFEAVLTGKDALVKACLRIGVEKNCRNKSGETPLISAARCGHVSVSRVLIGAGADVNIGAYGYGHGSRCFSGYTALHWAAKADHGDVAVELLRAGACLDAQSGSGDTPLHVAVSQNSLSCVKDLLNLGADVTIRNQERETALICALRWWAIPDVVEALLRKGADVNAKGMETGGNSLHAFCAGIKGVIDVGLGGWEGEEDAKIVIRTVDLLLRWGVDERSKDKDGNVPADLVRELWGAGVLSEAEEDAECPIRPALARAPANKAWYRRGWLVMLRRRFQRKTDATKRHRGASYGCIYPVQNLIDLDEALFRKIVTFI